MNIPPPQLQPLFVLRIVNTVGELILVTVYFVIFIDLSKTIFFSSFFFWGGGGVIVLRHIVLIKQFILLQLLVIMMLKLASVVITVWC